MLFAAAFDADATERYSRHLLMPEIGCEGQKTLMDTSVLVVGAGGLGSPVLLYLAAAGIGTFGIVDYDTVDLSNLQRQIIHSEQSVGKSKCESARSAILGLNSRLNVKVYDNMFTTENALDIVRDYDIVVDATDNAPTRYLISDCCVILGKPLVSASALRTEGQLTVYNFEGGPCYRCIFPNPPLAASVTNCSDGGVLGAVVGVLGSLQAMEVVKVAMKLKCPDRFRNVEVMAGRMLMYSGFHCSFRNFKLRAKKSDCAACGIKPTITASSMPNYEAFCGSAACDKSTSLKILQRDERITCEVLFLVF
jgi:adenylyltransferase/sulfurtransferase